MKVEPTKGVDKIQVKHNRVLFWIILILIALFIILIIYMMSNWEEWEKEKNKEGTEIGARECSIDSDCIKETCCHASTCTSIENAPECGELFCTAECAPGTLDCGGGECKCVNGNCKAVFVE